MKKDKKEDNLKNPQEETQPKRIADLKQGTYSDGHTPAQSPKKSSTPESACVWSASRPNWLATAPASQVSSDSTTRTRW